MLNLVALFVAWESTPAKVGGDYDVIIGAGNATILDMRFGGGHGNDDLTDIKDTTTTTGGPHIATIEPARAIRLIGV